MVGVGVRADAGAAHLVVVVAGDIAAGAGQRVEPDAITVGAYLVGRVRIEVGTGIPVDVVGHVGGIGRPRQPGLRALAGDVDRHRHGRAMPMPEPTLQAVAGTTGRGLGIGLADGPAQAVAAARTPGVAPAIDGGPTEVVTPAGLGGSGIVISIVNSRTASSNPEQRRCLCCFQVIAHTPFIRVIAASDNARQAAAPAIVQVKSAFQFSDSLFQVSIWVDCSWEQLVQPLDGGQADAVGVQSVDVLFSLTAQTPAGGY